ncbi:MAG TPA: ATP-binding protein [Pyrinomonadaceae bacterium]|nr:ATP-binding protein [Pyrinomonadaceae bacterium]
MRVSRLQVWLTVLVGVFLVGTVVMFALFALAPDTAAINRPILLTGFIVALFLSLVCIAWLLRGLLRPYSQLVGEAKRAPVAHSGAIQNEAEFVLETFQNVIAQLQAQQAELKRLTEQASERAESAERFSERIVASMPTGLIAFDSSGRATVINGPARILFENEAHTPGEHYRAIFSRVPALADMVETCLASGRLFRREEIEATNGAPQAKRLGATVAPIDPGESGARGALCLLTDITEVTRLREQVAMKRNLESLGEMSAGLAHEFKNAMAALHGYAQFLQSIDHDERGKAAAAGLLQEVRSLSDMSTAFLNFARPQPLQLEDVSLDELIAECARELKSLFEERRVELIIKGFSSAQPPPGAQASSLLIQGDARMLRQALLNLLRNAAEAIEEDKTLRRVAVNLSTQTERGQPWATISIRDTGHGIPESDLQRIFIPFFTTKSQGHGVGLALAHRVITEHGGALTVANAADGGALFTIRLPR